MKIQNIIMVAALFTFQACNKMPKSVWIDKSGLYPEGLEYNEDTNSFLVTSLKEGSVGQVDSKGNYTRLVDDANLISAIGIRVDVKRNRILVANSDPGVSIKTSPITQKKIAGLGIYNLSDGKLVKYVNLSALLPKDAHFANDIALDKKDGTVYVTDSFSPVIYKVSPEGEASIFIRDERFTGDGFNLNGIVLYKDYLVVAKHNDGSLYKIPLAHPENITEVKVAQKFPGADGLIKMGNHNLAVISNGSKTVYNLQSNDDFQTANVIASNIKDWRYNTTGVMVCGKPYVLNAELDMLFTGKPDVTKFEIRALKF